MNSKYIKINFHGKLADSLKRSSWRLNVSSIAEAMHAVNVQTSNGIKKYLLNRKNIGSRLRVIINEKEEISPQDIKNEFTLLRQDVNTVDIIPVLEGAGWDWIGLAAGITGMYFAENKWSFLASLAITAYSISNMLAKLPEMPENRQITNPSSDPTALANSYLFNGPVNVINDGGPVPVGYGRVMVGSQVIMAAYGVKRILIRDAGRVI